MTATSLPSSEGASAPPAAPASSKPSVSDVSARKTRRRFGAFLIANLVQRGGQLMLLALLVMFARPEDVTWFGLFGSFFLLVVPVVTQNTHTAIGRLFFIARSPSDQQRLASTLLSTGVGLALLGGGLAVAVLVALADALELPATFSALYPLMFAGSVIYATSQFAHVMLRVTDKVQAFVRFGFLLGFGYPVLFVLAAVTDDFNVVAAARGYVLAHACAATWGLFALRGGFARGGHWFDRQVLRKALTYGSGTCIYCVVQWLVNYGGRWIGAAHIPAEGMVSYTLVTQFYAIVGTLVTVFFETYRVPVLERFSDGRVTEGRALLWRPTRHALLGVLAVHAVLFALLPWVDDLVGAAYRIELSLAATSVLIGVAGVFTVRAFWLAVSLVMTRTFAIISVGAGVVTVGLGLVLAPRLGAFGLMLASLVGLITQATVATRVLEGLVHRGPQIAP